MATAATPQRCRVVVATRRTAIRVESSVQQGSSQLTSGPMQSLKSVFKRHLKRLRHGYVRTFCAFTPAELRARLEALGVARGDTVLVHSSYDAFLGFSGKPTDVITLLQDAVGAEGTLLMPTLPFTGTAVAWVKEHPVFDVTRTPSRMGLLTEIFRRSRGVIRSVHPTHPVAIWGKDAEALAAGHHLARTPCGKGSPFARLLERHGKILLLGADITSLTFFHLAEELLETQLPVTPFTRETYHLDSKQKDGSTVTTETRLYEPVVSRRRNLLKLVPELQQHNAWRETRIGRLTITLLGADDTYQAIVSLANRGIFCYD